MTTKLLINNFQLSEHFNLREFMSPDTSEVMLAPELIPMLEDIRGYLHVPIKITSGYRTPEHNIEVGGVPNSYHTSGMAVDFIAAAPAEDIAKACNLAGFTFIKYYPITKHFHVDIGVHNA